MDTSVSVLDALEAHLEPATIQKMSAEIGSDRAATSHAISMAVPILLGRLSKNSADADGAAALDSALGGHGGGMLDDVGALLKGGAGAAILGHILGSRRASVEDGVSRATGLTAQHVAQLLTMLAPLVMGVLGRMKQQQGLDAATLPVVLGQANLDMSRQSAAVGDLSRVMDSDDDSTIAEELARIGSSMVTGTLGQRTGAAI